MAHVDRSTCKLSCVFMALPLSVHALTPCMACCAGNGPEIGDVLMEDVMDGEPEEDPPEMRQHEADDQQRNEEVPGAGQGMPNGVR